MPEPSFLTAWEPALAPTRMQRMSKRDDELTTALAPLLNAENGWAEDPIITLRVLSQQARDMIVKLAEIQPGALSSRAYWRFVADETEALCDRVRQQFNT